LHFAPNRPRLIGHMVARELRAELRDNPIAGQQLAGVARHPGSLPAKNDWGGRCLELPTLHAPMEAIIASLTRLLDKVERLGAK